MAERVAAEMAKIKALHWTGRAQVVLASQRLDLVVETRIEPFVRAWTSSYKFGQSPMTARRLRVEGQHAFVLRDDLETDLMPDQARHEREQYGLYGYLLKILISQKLLATEPLPDPDYPWLVERPDFPSILFLLSGRRVTGASYSVHKPSGGGKVDQKISFSGTIGDPALAWPRTIEIAQNGKPYFKLVLENFTIQLA